MQLLAKQRHLRLPLACNPTHMFVPSIFQYQLIIALCYLQGSPRDREKRDRERSQLSDLGGLLLRTRNAPCSCCALMECSQCDCAPLQRAWHFRYCFHLHVYLLPPPPALQWGRT